MNPTLCCRYVSIEAVQRFSKRMIDKLAEFNKAGIHSWSEQSACTYAAVSEMSILSLKKEHIGNPFTYYEPRKFTSTMFDKYFTDPNRRDRLYHPVKLRS